MNLNQFHPLLLLLLLLLSSRIYLSDARDDHDKRDIDQYWCKSEVPYPHSCSLYIPRPHDGGVVVDRSDFYHLSLHAALARAILARANLRRMRKQVNCQENTTDYNAWFDCEKLYGNTVVQLNRTILSHDCTPCDVQTWLSAALTNLNMCNKIFETDDVTRTNMNMITSLSKYNVSELISNCLAIHEPMFGTVNATGNFKLTEFMRRNLRSVKADIVVSKDGSGRYKSVAAAVVAGGRIGRSKGKRLVIYVKSGVYRESVNIPSAMDDVTLVGDGKGKTIITGSRSYKNGYTMITCATVAVFGDGFVAKDLTFRNTYGPGSQAVALLLASDSAVVHRASIEGYQDTLCVFSQRQFFRDCDIYGTIDFIFGNAAVVFQKCNIYARKPLHGEGNVLTAQARTDPNQNTGIVIQFCNIIPSRELLPVQRSVKTYLGRPWKKYSRTVYLQSYISGIVDPAGWMSWRGSFALDTLYYAEYKNTGSGSRRSERVNWPGYHIIRKFSSVSKFTVDNFIGGRMWIPKTGTPFRARF